jgi:hypothetical protein
MYAEVAEVRGDGGIVTNLSDEIRAKPIYLLRKFRPNGQHLGLRAALRSYAPSAYVLLYG